MMWPENLPALSFRDSLLFLVTCALAVHLVYKKYEIQPTSLLPTTLLLGVIPGASSTFLLRHFSSAAAAYATGFAVFYSCILLSVVLYRLSPWHPLAKYPGPLLARISKFWMISVVLTGKQHHVFKKLHDQYGPYIRIGPNEVSFVDADLIPKILGTEGIPKGPMWDGRRDPDAPPSLIAIRNYSIHSQKRKAWNHAFSTAAVKDYGPIIAKRCGQLADALEARAGNNDGNGAVDLAEWFGYFAFDFMGDMAFGGGFELMRDGDKGGIWTKMQRRIELMAWQMHIPWATRLMLKLPFATDAVVKFRNFTIECAKKRKERGATVKDLFYYLINEDDTGKSSPPLSEIVVSGELAIVAGSDTTAVALSGLFYFLITHPEDYKRLRKEVDSVFPPGEGDPFDASKLAEMRFLNAVINETLRLQPAVGSGLQRAPEVGKGGRWLGEHFIPEGTAVTIPPYTLQRDPRYFSPSPDEFWPERWLQSTEPKKESFTMDMAAFIPFSLGPANCAGKNLALAEMRAVVAILVQRFEVRFAKGYDPKQWEEELEDMFVVKNGKLPVTLTLRV